MVETAASFDNVNIMLERATGTHTDVGRYHNEEESKIKDKELRDILDKYDPNYSIIPVDKNTVETIYNLLNSGL